MASREQVHVLHAAGIASDLGVGHIHFYWWIIGGCQHTCEAAPFFYITQLDTTDARQENIHFVSQMIQTCKFELIAEASFRPRLQICYC